MKAARAAFSAAKAAANACWSEGRYEDCLAALDEAIKLNASDACHRYRARCEIKLQRKEAAVAASGRAVEHEPLNGANHSLHSQCLYRSHRLREAGHSYLTATRLGYGAERSDARTGYAGFLGTVRRERIYFANPRRDLPKVLGSGELIGCHRVTRAFFPLVLF